MLTASQQIGSTTYRKVYTVNGNFNENYTLTGGTSGLTGAGMSIKYATWNVGGGATGFIQVVWDGSTPVVALTLAGSGTMDLKGAGVAIPNTAVAPTGNLLVQSTMGAGAYSLLLEVGMPYNAGGQPH